MHLTCVSMVRDEIPIIDEFAIQIGDFFDQVVFVDHRSTDGTREFLSELSRADRRFDLVTYDDPGYFQSEIMTAIATEHPSCKEADWVFFLDSDEVVPFDTRQEFRQALKSYQNSTILRIYWKNLVPENFDCQNIFGRNYYCPKMASNYCKVAYRPAQLPVGRFSIAQGNHAIEFDRNIASPQIDEAHFPLFHIPIRTIEQVRQKVASGVRAYESMGEHWGDGLGFHWVEIERLFAERGFDTETANFVAARYGDPASDCEFRLSIAEMERSHCRIRLFGDRLQRARNLRKKLMAAQPRGIQPGLPAIVGDGPKVSVFGLRAREQQTKGGAPMSRDGRYDALAVEQCAPVDGPRLSPMALPALEPATWAIDDLPPTGWGRHIPFMFFLMASLRPRRFVELGSHYGASFFAACQAIAELNLRTQAIAIDLWTGDQHAGAYDESVYKYFCDTLESKYSRFAEIIRMDFNFAVDRFEDTSIDLLHIDGLHTYEAVKNDYETWRKKLTPNGVILFHDTRVYRDDFGVWTLWEEIKTDALSFEFKHEHGLGILAFGSPDTNPIAAWIKSIQDTGSEALIEEYFSRLGDLSVCEASNKLATNDPHSLEDRPWLKDARPTKVQKKTVPVRVGREMRRFARKLGLMER